MTRFHPPSCEPETPEEERHILDMIAKALFLRLAKEFGGAQISLTMKELREASETEFAIDYEQYPDCLVFKRISQ